MLLGREVSKHFFGFIVMCFMKVYMDVKKEMLRFFHKDVSWCCFFAERACPFLLLTLKESADGLQGALLASLLDVMVQRCARLTVRPALSRDRAIALVQSSSWARTLLPLLDSKPSPALDKQDQVELTSWVSDPLELMPSSSSWPWFLIGRSVFPNVLSLGV